jgi:hypothetical protein
MNAPVPVCRGNSNQAEICGGAERYEIQSDRAASGTGLRHAGRSAGRSVLRPRLVRPSCLRYEPLHFHGCLFHMSCTKSLNRTFIAAAILISASEWQTQQEVVTLVKAIAAENQEAYRLFAGKLLEVEPSFANLIPRLPDSLEAGLRSRTVRKLARSSKDWNLGVCDRAARVGYRQKAGRQGPLTVCGLQNAILNLALIFQAGGLGNLETSIVIVSFES